jgi:protein-disulfide isomerase
LSPSESEAELTRKQRRDQARADRRALEDAQASGAARLRRLQLLGGAVAVVAIAIVLVLALTGGGGKGGIPTSTSGEHKEKAAVASLIGGIPQSANALGKPQAPVTLEYFGDLECSVCKAFTLETLPAIVRRWVRAGDLRIEYHSLETATREPETFKKQQIAAYAAGAQDKAWYFIETFYHEQGAEGSGYVTQSYLEGIANQVPGLNLAQWQRERGDQKFAAEVEEDAQTANSEGFTGTPSFLIGRSGGSPSKLGTGLLPESTFNGAIEKLLKA